METIFIVTTKNTYGNLNIVQCNDIGDLIKELQRLKETFGDQLSEEYKGVNISTVIL